MICPSGQTRGYVDRPDRPGTRRNGNRVYHIGDSLSSQVEGKGVSMRSSQESVVFVLVGSVWALGKLESQDGP
jgi:hypothetical protein